jgi:hypothetical protein
MGACDVATPWWGWYYLGLIMGVGVTLLTIRYLMYLGANRRYYP